MITNSRYITTQISTCNACEKMTQYLHILYGFHSLISILIGSNTERNIVIECVLQFDLKLTHYSNLYSTTTVLQYYLPQYHYRTTSVLLQFFTTTVQHTTRRALVGVEYTHFKKQIGIHRFSHLSHLNCKVSSLVRRCFLTNTHT